jgi:UDP-N-acetylmuramyl pentapeptide phosphotransferase/UDP-N-acetylglucosamine-1-phosphate transferase
MNFSSEGPEFQYYIASFVLIFFLGMKDDIIIISPTKKFLGQVAAAAILVYKSHLLITNVHGLFGFEEIHPFVSYLLSLLSIVVIINAFNLIDGVDGLAGGLGLISTLVFGTFFLINGNVAYAGLAFSFAGCLVGFLYYNFSPARIFMGDTGSLLTGLVNSILVIKFIQTGNSYSTYPIFSAPAVAFAVLLLPLMDTLRVFSIRIISGRSPFKADRNHIHHLFLNKGFDHRSVTVSCVLATIAVTAIAFFLQHIGTTTLLVVMMLLFFGLVYAITYKKSKYKLTAIKGDAKAVLPKESIKIVSFVEQKVAVVPED